MLLVLKNHYQYKIPTKNTHVSNVNDKVNKCCVVCNITTLHGPISLFYTLFTLTIDRDKTSLEKKSTHHEHRYFCQTIYSTQQNPSETEYLNNITQNQLPVRFLVDCEKCDTASSVVVVLHFACLGTCSSHKNL